MKYILTLMLALALSVGANAQSFKIEGNKVISVKVDKTKTPDKKTQFTLSTGDGELPIYLTSRGALYVIRTSKKTGKEYRYYLPKEMREELLKRIK